MSGLDVLVREYPGDQAWQDYVDAWKDMGASPDPDVAKLVGDDGLALVLDAHFDDYALRWLEDRPPVLDGQQPLDVLRGADGMKIMRTVLMRFP